MAKATKLAPGLLASRYAYVAERGRGATGRVIEVCDRANGEARRALKVVSPQYASRLGWEFSLLARVAHPHIATVYELLRVEATLEPPYSLARGCHVLVEELLEGPTADACFAAIEDQAERERRALEVGIAIAGALATIHGEGLIHGDVKPANIIVPEDWLAGDGGAPGEGDDGEHRVAGDGATNGRGPWLIDLGLAAPPGASRFVSGTPGYLAPEALLGQRSIATDLFALGVTMLNLLAGASPASGGGMTPEHKELAAGAPGLAEGESSLALRRLLASMVAYHAEARPQCAREVVASLVGIAADAGLRDVRQMVRAFDLAPTPLERSLRALVLPHTGHRVERQALEEAIGKPGVVIVVGPAGSGRTRLIRESLIEQSRRSAQPAAGASGPPMPTYLARRGSLGDGWGGHDSLIHVEDADQALIPDALALVDTARMAGHAVTVVLEREDAAGGAQPDGVALIEVGSLPDSAIAQLLDHAFGRAVAAPALIAAARAASGGLAGRLCRLLSMGFEEGRELERPQALRAMGELLTERVCLDDAAAVVAEALAVAGGELGGDSLGRCLGGQIVAAAMPVMLRAGIVYEGHDGAAILRPDVARRTWDRLLVQERKRWATRLDPHVEATRARAFIEIAKQQPAAAELLFTDEARRLRRQGDPEAAVALLAAGLRALGEAAQERTTASADLRRPFTAEPGARAGLGLGGAMCLALADGLRALGRYREALALLQRGGSSPRDVLAPDPPKREAAEPSAAVAGLPDMLLATAGGAAGALVLRAEIARLAGDVVDAEQDLARALSLLDAAADRREGGLAEPHPASADRSEPPSGAAAEAREGAVQRIEAVARDDLRARATVTAAWIAIDRGDLHGARDVAARFIDDLPDGGQSLAPTRHSALLSVSAWAAYGMDRPAEAYAAAEQAVAMARRADDKAAWARAESIVATIVLRDGAVREAAQRFGRAFALAESIGELHLAATAMVNLGLARLDIGDLGAAMSLLRDGGRRQACLGRDADVARALYNLANLASLIGDDDLALFAARKAAAIAARADDATANGYASLIEAETLFGLGQRDGMQAAVEQIDGCRSRLTERDGAIIEARLAQLLLASGETSGAQAMLAAAQGRAGEHGDSHVALEIALATAQQLRDRGDGEAADLCARTCIRHAEQAGTFEALLRAHLLVVGIADWRGQPEAAGASLGTARTLLDAATASLPTASREKLRQVPSYQRALSSRPTKGRGDEIRDDLVGSEFVPPTRPETADRWRRLVEFARRLSAERRIGRLKEEILDAAVELTGAERAILVVRSMDGTLRAEKVRGIAASLTDQSEAFSRSLVARAMDSESAVTSVDALNEEALKGAISVHALALRSVLVVPLRWRDGGGAALYLDDRLRPSAFDAHDRALMEDLAAIAETALEGALLFREQRRQARRLAVLGRRLERQVEVQAIELVSLRHEVGNHAISFPGMVAESPAMRDALRLAERVAASDAAVLITGESGTGKELVARAIHRLSPRGAEPFVSENCGAIPESLLESALFGHVRGAFTGAERARVGLFEAADGGTLFLDEIGEMSPAMQAKLLRAVQLGEIRPVGAPELRKVDVRIVAATHRDLAEMVRAGTFRQDLYYRLAVVAVPLPPLRERVGDIEPMVVHFIERLAAGREVRLDRQALALLSTHDWPGNVRELENEVQRALVLADDTILPGHLSPAVRREETSVATDLRGQVDALERRLIREALERFDGNQTQTAKALGLSRYGLQKKLKRLSL